MQSRECVEENVPLDGQASFPSPTNTPVPSGTRTER